MVDIYYALYGSKRPMCLPQAELAAMFKPQKVPQPTSTVVSDVVVDDVEETPKLFAHDDEIDTKPIVIESKSPPLLPTTSSFDDKTDILADESVILKEDAVEEFDSVLVKTEPEELEVIDVIVSFSF